MEFDTDVLVVGAGPTGLVMAAELIRHGVRCRIIDRAGAPSDKSKALVIQPRTLEIFEVMGIAGSMVERGQLLKGAHLYTHGREFAHLKFGGLKSPFPFPLILEQSETERVLIQYLRDLGRTVERRVELVGLASHDAYVEAELCFFDGRREKVRTGWVMGCDGVHSTVRHLLRVPFEGAPYEEEFSLADVRVDWDAPGDEVHAFVRTRGMCGAIPMHGEQRYRLITLRNSVDSALGFNPSLREFQEILDQVSPFKAKLSEPRWLSQFRLHRRIVPALQFGRVFLAGDAAHVHSPAGGQGMNTGIQDAYNLAWKLALVNLDAAPMEFLETYDEERHPVARNVLRITNLFFRSAFSSRPWVRWIRRFLGAWLLKQHWIQTRMRDFVSELYVHYRGSSLVKSDLRWKRFPLAGDRIPDGVFVDAATRKEVRIFDLLRSLEHVLLVCADDADGFSKGQRIGDEVSRRFGLHVQVYQVWTGVGSPKEFTTRHPILLDPSSQVSDALGMPHDGLLLMRPDGYIGFTGRVVRATRLIGHLKLFLKEKE